MARARGFLSLSIIGVYSVRSAKKPTALILLSTSKEGPADNLDVARYKAPVEQLLEAYEASKREFKEEREKRRLQQVGSPLDGSFEAFDQMFGGHYPPPRPSLTDLREPIPEVVFVQHMKRAINGRDQEIADAVLSCDAMPPRDGRVHCTELEIAGGGLGAIVRWEKRTIITPALEIKAAVEQTLPRALRKPRLQDVQPPEPMPVSPLLQTVTVDLDVLDSLEVNFDDELPIPPGGLEEVLGSGGFEAIAWFQSFHVYSDTNWGIYFHARMMDSLAGAIAKEMRRAGESRAGRMAVKLALGMTFAHEMFHARVEVASSWLELAIRRPRYLEYMKRVYRHFKLSPDWREEALANWSAWEWWVSTRSRWTETRSIKNPEHIDRIVESCLSISPAGYREWRCGQDASSWRALAVEVATAMPAGAVKQPRGHLPLERMLANQALFDLRGSDVPTYFVGRGIISDCLFSTPSRREAERLLRFYGYSPLPGRGKGSHEIWQAGERRTFSLPKRDPVSLGVFGDLLQHLGIKKRDYVDQIRPQI